MNAKPNTQGGDRPLSAEYARLHTKSEALMSTDARYRWLRKQEKKEQLK